MKSIFLKFNTWYAFKRVVDELEDKYDRYLIHGEVYVPKHLTFKNWQEFYDAYYKLSKLLEYYHNNLFIINDKLKADWNNDNPRAVPQIFGYVVVEVTDPWIR